MTPFLFQLHSSGCETCKYFRRSSTRRHKTCVPSELRTVSEILGRERRRYACQAKNRLSRIAEVRFGQSAKRNGTKSCRRYVVVAVHSDRNISRKVTLGRL